MKLDLIFFYIMKRFILLTLCLFTAVFTACDDEKTDNRSWFREPVTSVEGTTVTVKCLSLLGEAVLETTQPRFVCRPAAGEGETVELPAEVDETILSARFTDLLPETVYLTYAYVVVGDSRLSSPTVAFRTGSGGEDPDPEPEPEPGDPEFGELAAVSVTASSATLEGEFSYDGAEPVSALYFSYAAGGGSARRADIDPVQPGKVHADISGLSASTAYTFRLCVEIGGETYRSAAGSFTTLAGSGGSSDDTPHPGWAELPAEKDGNGDYYYAYHLCPDVYVKGTDRKMRNFSVCYSDELKCPVWVAAPMHDCYAVENSGRTNAYGQDPDIPVYQPEKRKGYTRGHMLGSAERLVSRATNVQVCYCSNIAPQLGQPYFNTGGGAWNTLEDWVDTQWEGYADTTYQVIGSYWKNKNTVVNETTIPTHYYKVLLRTKGHTNKWVAECSRDELQCIAIMVEHRTYSKNEVPKPSQYEAKGMLHSVAELERMTGLTFFPNVPNAPKDTYDVRDWNL